MNRLADETSPYLRQHATNPVDWFAWGPEAFNVARATDRPILLSIGYSSCHWCHVMARECFEDDETAAMMNRLFVNVKVDREERPDIDSIYMDAVQAMVGRGGWPMTVFMDGDGKPFYGGTYFPKPSFLQLMEKIDEIWTTQRSAVEEQGQQLVAAMGRLGTLSAGETLPGLDELNNALQSIANNFDPEWGGFGAAPKFPQTMSLELCLRAYVASGGEGAKTVVTTSLDAMASGGIYDHIGGGFSRYSTDAFWMVPHFEKMLYDQAQLARLYLHCWQCTGEQRYAQVAAETIEYVLRDLRHSGGGFFSAEDADSLALDGSGHHEEGAFYVWRPEQLREALPTELYDSAVAWYGVTDNGNFEGSNILHRPVRGDLIRPDDVTMARAALLHARNERPRPGLDDKVLTEWNALMLSTLAEAAAVAQVDDWMVAALANAEFLLAELRRPDGRWMRSWQADGGARHLAIAADYAALVDAFTRLAEASGQARWIDEARTTADAMLDLFWDPIEGGLFTTGEDGEPLVVRTKDLLDNATPSANSMAAVALYRLSALTGDARYRNHADRIVMLVAPLAAEHPGAFGHLLAAVDLLRSDITEIVIPGPKSELVSIAQRCLLPNAVLAWGERYDSPLWEGREDGVAYVCRNFTCDAPATTVDELLARLGITTG
ncbi:MAG: thioredoxin domain-containing protein [Acidimicrobiia bacterium]